MGPRSFIHRQHRSFVATIAVFAAVTLAVLGQSPVASATGGHILWTARYGRAASGNAMAVSADGARVYVTGYSLVSGSLYDYATAAIDTATGATVWTSFYGGPSKGIDRAVAIGLSPDGDTVYVTGQSTGSTKYIYDYATVAYDATTGAQVWASTYDAGGSDWVTALAVSPDGSMVYVTGQSQAATHGPDEYATVAYLAETGTQVWVSRHGVPNGQDATPSAIGVSPDGSLVFVTGDSFRYGRTIAYDAATGAEVWSRRYGSRSGVDSTSARALEVSPDGSSVFVTGVIFEASPDYATVAYDAATGAKLWSRRFDGKAHSDDEAYLLAVSPDGARLYVSGTSVSRWSYQRVATVAYDTSTGTRLWLSTYPRPNTGEAWPKAIAVSPDGEAIYVAGGRLGMSVDSATVAYDSATGAQSWARLYDGRAHSYDEADAAVVSPDGSRVYVSGTSQGRGDYDSLTIAYSTS